MKQHKALHATLMILMLIMTSVILSACNTHSVRVGAVLHSDPPPHRYRPHHYHYYPNASVYYDIDSHMYFYLSGGNWVTSITLPNPIRIILGNSVRIQMEGARPYTNHRHHVKKYPPGLLKKKHRAKKKHPNDNRHNNKKKYKDKNKDKSKGKGKRKDKGKGKYKDDDDEYEERGRGNGRGRGNKNKWDD